MPRAIALSLLALVVGCAPPPSAQSPDPSPTAVAAEPAPPAAAPTPAPAPPDYMGQALDAATSAILISESARSAEDWQMAAAEWENAIALLEQVPETDPARNLATEKLDEYRGQLAQAQQKASEQTYALGSVSGSSSEMAGVSPRVALAKHLKDSGVVMYEAYWCGVCEWQLEQFGEEAAEILERVECDPRGENAQPQLCRQANVRAYPSWEIDGELFRGGLSLQQLADFSGYEGDRNF